MSETELNEKKHFEQKEQPSPRTVEIYVVRHGKQEEYEDAHSALSKEGEDQARQFAEELLKNYANQDVIIKVKKSSADRASRTGDIITETLKREIEKAKFNNVKLFKTREAKNLKTTGALGPIIENGVDYSKSVDE